MFRPGESRMGWAALALTCLLSQSAAQAANVTITGNDPRQNITVTVEDATVDFVLDNLHKKFGFELAGLPPNIAGGEAQTVTMSGNLHDFRNCCNQPLNSKRFGTLGHDSGHACAIS